MSKAEMFQLVGALAALLCALWGAVAINPLIIAVGCLIGGATAVAVRRGR